MDFCFSWLRLGLNGEDAAFKQASTRHHAELTGNQTLGRGHEHFAEGLSAVFKHYAEALKPGAPFVFTYHHNDPLAYLPIVVAILDAGLECTATLPAPAEMGASLHISGTNSSVLDSVFVCRATPAKCEDGNIEAALLLDVEGLRRAKVRVSLGDMKCLMSGHIARVAINRMRSTWVANRSLSERMCVVRDTLAQISREFSDPELLLRLLAAASQEEHVGVQLEAAV